MPSKMFVDVPGFPDYEISRAGVLRWKSSKRILKQHQDPRGYLRVSLKTAKGFRPQAIHRLMGFTFLPNPEKHKGMNHKNGITTDNRLANLEWLSQRDNVLHANRLGLRKYAVGKDHWWCKRNPGREPGVRLYTPRPVPKADVTMLRAPNSEKAALAKRVFGLRNQGKRYREIALQEHISITLISDILHGIAWVC